MRIKRAILPAHIWNHCHPVGSLTTFGGGSSTFSSSALRMRVFSSFSRIPWRARLSQVAVTSTESSDIRVTFTVACPLRRLKPVPTGIASSIPVGKVVCATLGGTGCCISANPFTSCRLSLTWVDAVIRPGPLQLVVDRAIVPVTTRSSASHRAVQSGDGPVKFSVFIDSVQ